MGCDHIHFIIRLKSLIEEKGVWWKEYQLHVWFGGELFLDAVCMVLANNSSHIVQELRNSSRSAVL